MSRGKTESRVFCIPCRTNARTSQFNSTHHHNTRLKTIESHRTRQASNSLRQQESARVDGGCRSVHSAVPCIPLQRHPFPCECFLSLYVSIPCARMCVCVCAILRQVHLASSPPLLTLTSMVDKLAPNRIVPLSLSSCCSHRAKGQRKS